MSGTREPNSIDVHVGRRVRLRRHAIGMTQQQLAAALNLTFQQIQKYERGANRISASKLFEISRILNASISYFFDGLVSESPDSGDATLAERQRVEKLLIEPGGQALVGAFLKIGSRTLKRSLVDLAVALAIEDKTSSSEEPMLGTASSFPAN
jgi:transcriptional regulator with XRE-family HTH domain